MNSKKQKRHEKRLDYWLDVICREVEFVDIKPYSHNIISVALKAIASEFGNKEANNAIDEYNLEALGWRKVHARRK